MSTFTEQVSQSSDDGQQITASPFTVSITATVTKLLPAALTGDCQYFAFRIQNVTIPPGATIGAAAISLWAPSASFVAMDATIYGNKVANPSALTASASYISGLAQTTNSVNWSATLTSGQFNSSPDISAIITELIGQGGWASDNAMLFILKGVSSSDACEIENYDGSSSEAPTLSVTYTTSSVPGAQTISLANDPTNPTTAIDITITAGTGSPTSYDIERSTAGISGTFSTLATGVTGASYTDSGLTPGTEYAYQVAGVNGSGLGTYCSPEAWATEPAAPAGLSATETTTSITVSFTSPSIGSNIAISDWGARIETPVGSGNWVSLGTVSNPFTAYGLSPGTQYGIEVDASIQSTNGDWAGSIVGPWSSELVATTVGQLPARCNIVMGRVIDGWEIVTW